jgi:hypothetical protein
MVKFTFNVSSLEQHSAVQCFTTEFKNHNKPTGLRPHQTKETDETANRNPLGLFDCHCHWRWYGCTLGGMVVVMTRGEMIAAWDGVFAIGKGIAYLLAMACMVKYLIG